MPCSRFRRIVKWIGAGLCALIVILWWANAGWSMGYCTKSAWIGLRSGSVVVGRAWTSGALNRGVYRYTWVDDGHFDFSTSAWPNRIDFISGPALLIPLWIPFVLVLLPTLLLFWVDLQRRFRGSCLNCGYDLTGNVSGVCPECGMAVGPSANS